MSRYKFQINGHNIENEDLGNSLNIQFQNLHKKYIQGIDFNFDDFINEALSYFDNNIGNTGAHDSFFNNFSVIWQYLLHNKRHADARLLWDDALKIAYKWENNNQNNRIHKGTPYYFWGVTCILSEAYEKGFFLMHQALEEDKITHNVAVPTFSPAYSFVTLDYDKQDQFFRPKVEEIAKFVDKKLAIYRNTRNRSLTLPDFKKRFLEQTTIQDIIFYFVYQLFKLKSLIEETDQKLMQNTFSSLFQANIIFNLCLVIDNTIKDKNTSGKYYTDHLKFLSVSSQLTINQSKISELNSGFINNFPGILNDLLNSQYIFNDGSTLNPIEEDLAISYGFRNYGAHRIEVQPTIYENFEDITNRILNALFFAIEKLY